MAEPKVKPSPHTAINELQEAFGSILLARKDKSDYKPKSHIPINQAWLPPPSPPVVCKGTGAFELFSFPRELRDRIYFHYLHRPDGVRHARTSSRCFPFDHPDDITNLFVTSKQVYEEAYQVYCRYNVVVFGPFRSNKSVEGVLRLFPERPASMLQRVCNQYMGSVRSNGWMYADRPNVKPADNWTPTLRDAHTFKAFFPTLREFTADWGAVCSDFAQYGLKFQDKTEEEKVQIWLTWMRACTKTGNVLPPRWLKFKLKQYHDSKRSMYEHEAAMNEAYVRLWRETAALRDADKDLQESGRQWIEETSTTGRRKRRRNKRHSDGVV